uniref:DUF4283 domain-containing protein n=1 Tax=Tanacetum cinerariifolium TaxID=118510 RepID=A0A6L2KL23_TANCI|nr:hypothetical protein [Tanacetum cinerariifolium]
MGNHVEPIVSANIDNVHNMDNIDSENTGSGYIMNDNIIHDEGTNSRHNNVKVDSDGESRKHEIKQVGTYANAAKKVNNHIQKKLNFVPTIVKDLGNEVVVFDEEMVEIGSKKWQLTLCGYFVGHKMHERDEKWCGNGKPLMVQKWNPDFGMERNEHSKIPLWGEVSVDGGKKDIENMRVDKNMYNRANFGMERKQGTPHYNNWQAMKQRNKNKANVENVGGSSKEKTFEEKFPKLPVRNDKKKAVDGIHDKEERQKNKFSVLTDVESDHMEEIQMIVDQYLNKRIQPSYAVRANRTSDLFTLPNMHDRWRWSLSGDGEFSVASVRNLIDDRTLTEVDAKTRWIKLPYMVQAASTPSSSGKQDGTSPWGVALLVILVLVLVKYHSSVQSGRVFVQIRVRTRLLHVGNIEKRSSKWNHLPTRDGRHLRSRIQERKVAESSRVASPAKARLEYSNRAHSKLKLDLNTKTELKARLKL